MQKDEIANEKNPNLKLGFTSQAGTKFFCHHDPLNISPERGVSAEEAKRYAEMCLSKKEMKALIKEYKKGVNNQDIVYSHSIIQEIEYRMDFIIEENSLFDLAALYYFIEGESVKYPTEAFNSKKREIFKTEADVRGFFLPTALNLMKRFSELPDKDLLIYLEQMKHLTKRIFRYIPESSWLNSMNS